MKYLSVCSGIEAATVAWHGLGWEPVAFAEIEAFPAAVLAHHYPTVPNLGDLTKYREWPDELLVEVDLLVGGTPCQAFSVAGQRRSLDDERGNLSLVYVNLYHHINEVRKRHGRPPAIALWENVPGVLSTKDNAFGCFIGGLLGCDEAPETEGGKWDKAGFLSSETVRVGYRVLDAQYFGVAQRRRRVFLAAVPCELVERFGERSCPSEILSLRESVLGNPPTRGAAWEGVARATAAGLTSSGRGVERCGESRGQDDVVIDVPPVCGTLSDGAHMGGGLTGRTHTPAESCPSVARTLTQRMHKGFDSTLDSQTPIVTQGGVFSRAAFGGNNRSGSIDVAASLLSHSGPHGGQDFTSETFLVEGHPDPAYAISAGQQGKGGVFGSGRDSHDTFVSVAFKPSHYTRGKDGAPSEVVAPLSADADKGDQDTVIATPIDMRQASRGEKVTNNRSQGSGGPPGHGVGDAGDPAFTVSERGQAVAVRTANTGANGHGVADEVTHTIDQVQGQAIAFKPGQSEAAGGTFVTEEFAPTMQSQNNGSTAVPAVAFTKSKRAQSNQDDESWVPGDVAQTQNQFDQGDTRATTVVAFTQNSRDEVRQINVDGSVAGALSADAGMHQTNYLAYGVTTEQTPKFSEEKALTITRQSPTGGGQPQSVAFANRTRDGIKVPEVMKDGVVPALTNPGQGGRADAVNIASAMQVRRLCPSECEALQGFPIGYTDVTYRKKPAADGPRYRALGNSMAVPCMWWLGKRIHEATQCD